MKVSLLFMEIKDNLVTTMFHIKRKDEVFRALIDLTEDPYFPD